MVASCPESVREAISLPIFSIRLAVMVPSVVSILWLPVYVSGGLITQSHDPDAEISRFFVGSSTRILVPVLMRMILPEAVLPENIAPVAVEFPR